MTDRNKQRRDTHALRKANIKIKNEAKQNPSWLIRKAMTKYNYWHRGLLA